MSSSKKHKHWSDRVHESVTSRSKNGQLNLIIKGGAEEMKFPFFGTVKQDKVIYHRYIKIMTMMYIKRLFVYCYVGSVACTEKQIGYWIEFDKFSEFLDHPWFSRSIIHLSAKKKRYRLIAFI